MGAVKRMTIDWATKSLTHGPAGKQGAAINGIVVDPSRCLPVPCVRGRQYHLAAMPGVQDQPPACGDGRDAMDGVRLRHNVRSQLVRWGERAKGTRDGG